MWRQLDAGMACQWNGIGGDRKVSHIWDWVAPVDLRLRQNVFAKDATVYTAGNGSRRVSFRRAGGPEKVDAAVATATTPNNNPCHPRNGRATSFDSTLGPKRGKSRAKRAKGLQTAATATII